MFVLTAKVSKPKLAAVIVGMIALVVLVVMAAVNAGQKQTTADAAAIDGSSNEARLRFLAQYGWDVNAEAAQVRQIVIPKDESDEVFARYNALQKSQGFDLTAYAGKSATQYVYEIVSDPAATAPVYATIIVYDGSIIGGDITDTAPDGLMHGFARPAD